MTPAPNRSCPFCDRIEFNEYEAVARDRQGAATVAAFEPLNPVVPGHRLFLPVEHVASAIASPDHCAAAMREAAAYARWKGVDCNLITSSGIFATQTIEHLHVHYVPRREGDDLHLPWTQVRATHPPGCGVGGPYGDQCEECAVTSNRSPRKAEAVNDERRSVRTIRPRRGDLEAATHPHTFQPSGEFAGASWVEVCDLCGLAQRTNRIHPEPVSAVSS